MKYYNYVRFLIAILLVGYIVGCATPPPPVSPPPPPPPPTIPTPTSTTTTTINENTTRVIEQTPVLK